MENILKKYVDEQGYSHGMFSRMIGCSESSFCAWYHGKGKPCSSYAWKIHKLTKGKIPLTHWGYHVVRGKIKKIINN